jgi:DNA-binding transcriptional LysR family regulator
VDLGRAALVGMGPSDAGADGQAISLESLVAGGWISVGNTDPLGELISQQLEMRGLDGHVAAVGAQTWYVARSLAARGVGYTLLDELTARSGTDDVTIRPVEPELSIGIFAVWRDGGMDSHLANVFVDTLRASISNHWCMASWACSNGARYRTADTTDQTRACHWVHARGW